MIYPYRCPNDHAFEIIAKVRDYNPAPECPECQEIAARVYTPPQFYGEKVEDAEYNPGLGCIVRDKKHREQICKQRGLIELGNENIEKVTKTMDQDREKRIAASWDEV